MMEIKKTKKVWVAWTNTDLTEGRGRSTPKAVCETEATAIRLGKGGSVMGSDCHVSESIAVLVGGEWLMPGKIEFATKKDIAAQEKLDAYREAEKKARDAGLSDDDIKALKH